MDATGDLFTGNLTWARKISFLSHFGNEINHCLVFYSYFNDLKKLPTI